ncbi:hypothetical protein BC938DRAFT_482906, partial [Jimgerdemannia flammicorona]
GHSTLLPTLQPPPPHTLFTTTHPLSPSFHLPHRHRLSFKTMAERQKRVLQEKNERLLLEMISLSGNNQCADCGAKGPRWASFNLGVFLCIRCGGLHRKMGTHISKVKSVTLDSWTPEQIEMMKQGGNSKANAKYNPHPEQHPLPLAEDDSGMERYIRSKWEKKAFMEREEREKESPKPQSSRQLQVVSAPVRSSSVPVVYQGSNHGPALQRLRDMGFHDQDRNRQVLTQTQGDIDAAAEILLRLPGARAPSSQPSSAQVSDEHKLTQLWNMGFQDDAKSREALRRTGGNVDVAAAILLEERKNNQHRLSPASTPSPTRDTFDRAENSGPGLQQQQQQPFQNNINNPQNPSNFSLYGTSSQQQQSPQQASNGISLFNNTNNTFAQQLQQQPALASPFNQQQTPFSSLTTLTPTTPAGNAGMSGYFGAGSVSSAVTGNTTPGGAGFGGLGAQQQQPHLTGFNGLTSQQHQPQLTGFSGLASQQQPQLTGFNGSGHQQVLSGVPMFGGMSVQQTGFGQQAGLSSNASSIGFSK